MPAERAPVTRRVALERGVAGALAVAVAACGDTRRTTADPAADVPRIVPAAPRKNGALTRRPMSPWAELRHEVRGRIDRPRSSDGLVYNERFSAVRPAAVVRVRDEVDVQALVRWAGRHGIPLRVRSGGHSYEGYSTAAGAVVMDLGGLRGVTVAGRHVHVGAGAQVIDVHARLARRGGVLPTASCPSVGIAGSTLGGGMGYSGRALGLTCDRVRSLRIVTPDGHLVHCDAREESDLFWACRGGGGGNFGVVTAFELAPHPARAGSWFSMTWPASAAGEALDAWQRFAPHAPDGLTSQFSLAAGGAVMCEGQFLGPARRLARLLAPLTASGGGLSIGSASALGLARRWARCGTWSLLECHTAGLSPGGRMPRARFDNGSAFVERPLDARGRAALLAAATDGGDGGILLDSWGGAIGRVRPHATAFAHRSALFNVQLLTDGSPTGTAWKRRTLGALRPHTSGHAYVNYIDRGEPDYERAYYGANLERLRAIKARVDPDRLLDFPQAI